MPPDADASLFRRGALIALALTAVALSGCQTSQVLVHHLATATHIITPAPPKPKPPKPAELAWLGHWLTASASTQARERARAEAAYDKQATPRNMFRLALVLSVPGPSPKGDTPDTTGHSDDSGSTSTNLLRAQSLLQTLLADPTSSLSPAARTVARLDLTLVTQRLTDAQRDRTLAASNASEIAQLNAQLDTLADQNVSLQRQLDEASAKLAAIANIEKSLNQSKLSPLALGSPK
ncbi:MAG: hypothetical protein M0038_12195 [Pseudomonadota bacterium]|jgi:hypothetical protein|nr:hypothetical protein [Pseudomonadota bacterium]